MSWSSLAACWPSFNLPVSLGQRTGTTLAVDWHGCRRGPLYTVAKGMQPSTLLRHVFGRPLGIMQRLMQLCLRHVTSDRSVEFKRIDKNFKQLRKEVRRVLSSFSGQSAGMIHKANVASQPALGTCHASILVLSQEELNEKSTLQSKRDMSSTFPLKQTTNRDR